MAGIRAQQNMLVLRLPDDLAPRMQELVKAGQDPDNAVPAEMIKVRCDGPQSTFVFEMEGKDYPALVSNLPAPVEVQKTFDSKIFLKSGDVGQV